VELTHEFSVDLPVERAWALLLDIERIAPCMPGAVLESAEGELYTGVVKVKVGPVTAQYRGTVRFAERDEAARRAVLRAEGRETRGQGNANATITVSLAARDGGTAVGVVTDLVVTGRVAQFGRGVISEVSSRLLQQFVDCLATTFVTGEAPASAGADSADSADAGTRPGAVSGGAEDAADRTAAPRVAGRAGGGTPEHIATARAGAVPSGENGFADPRPAPPAGTGADAVDLIALVRPMLARRVRPLAAAAAGVAVVWVLVRARRSRRSR